MQKHAYPTALNRQVYVQVLLLNHYTTRWLALVITLQAVLRAPTGIALHHADAEEAEELRGVGDGVAQRVVGRSVLVGGLEGGGRERDD